LGRFGPYVVHDQGKEGKDYRSLKKDDDVLTVTLERALELLAEPKSGRGKRKAAAKPLRELGAHPADSEPVNIYDGPYGPYIKHGKVNVSLPEGETVESVKLETAVKLLADKAGTKAKSTRGRKTTKAAEVDEVDDAETGSVNESVNGSKSKATKAAASRKTTKASSSASKSTRSRTTKTSSSRKTSKSSKSS
jgi:DNA topoisomerase I